MEDEHDGRGYDPEPLLPRDKKDKRIAELEKKDDGLEYLMSLRAKRIAELERELTSAFETFQAVMRERNEARAKVKELEAKIDTCAEANRASPYCKTVVELNAKAKELEALVAEAAWQLREASQAEFEYWPYTRRDAAAFVIRVKEHSIEPKMPSDADSTREVK